MGEIPGFLATAVSRLRLLRRLGRESLLRQSQPLRYPVSAFLYMIARRVSALVRYLRIGRGAIFGYLIWHTAAPLAKVDEACATLGFSSFSRDLVFLFFLVTLLLADPLFRRIHPPLVKSPDPWLLQSFGFAFFFADLVGEVFFANRNLFVTMGRPSSI